MNVATATFVDVDCLVITSPEFTGLTIAERDSLVAELATDVEFRLSKIYGDVAA